MTDTQPPEISGDIAAMILPIDEIIHVFKLAFPISGGFQTERIMAALKNDELVARVARQIFKANIKRDVELNKLSEAYKLMEATEAAHRQELKRIAGEIPTILPSGQPWTAWTNVLGAEPSCK